MSETPRRCQLTFIISTGAQVTIMIAQTAEVTRKQLINAIENGKTTVLPAEIKDDKALTDEIVLRGDKIEFFSVLQPAPKPLIESLDRKILVQ